MSQGQIEFSKEVTVIGLKAFANNTDLHWVSLPRSVNTICASAFYNCTNLTNINLLYITAIKSCAFLHCKSLKSITLSPHLKEIEAYAFNDCPSLTAIEFSNINPFKDIYKFKISDTVIYSESEDSSTNDSSINDSSTNDSSESEPVTITGNTIRQLLQTLGLLSDVIFKSIDSDFNPVSISGLELKFYGWSNIDNNPMFKIISTEDNKCINEYFKSGQCKISGSFPDVNNEVVETCFSIQEPQLISWLDNGTYDQSYDYNYITKNIELLKIGKWAFRSCFNLTEITLPDNITAIDEYAFYNCSKLSAVGYKGIKYTNYYLLLSALKANNVTVGTSAFGYTKLSTKSYSSLIYYNSDKPINATTKLFGSSLTNDIFVLNASSINYITNKCWQGKLDDNYKLNIVDSSYKTTITPSLSKFYLDNNDCYWYDEFSLNNNSKYKIKKLHWYEEDFGGGSYGITIQDLDENSLDGGSLMYMCIFNNALRFERSSGNVNLEFTLDPSTDLKTYFDSSISVNYIE